MTDAKDPEPPSDAELRAVFYDDERSSHLCSFDAGRRAVYDFGFARGRASRDAEVAELKAEVERLRELSTERPSLK